MKLNKELQIKFNNDMYTIKKTFHIFEHRTENKFSRAEFLDDQRYTEIIRHALINGLTSFRGKRCVITVPNFEGTYFSILCFLDNKNTITLISVFHKKYKFWKSFNRVQNRINIFRGYIVPRMTSTEHNKKKFEKILVDRDLEQEDDYFKQSMKSFKRL